jgi:hypothetical protein
MKFKRFFRMFIEVDSGETIEVEYPLTITFDVKRNTLASSNTGHFQIFNLKADNRHRIYHDSYDTLTYRRILLQAGYEDESPLPTIFAGNIISASSYRQGTNFITDITAYDGIYGTANGQVNSTIPSGYSLKNTLSGVLGSMPKLNPGAIGDFSQQSSRGLTLMGNSWEIAQRLVSPQNGIAFVDNEIYNVIRKNEYLVGAEGITLINSETGLLQTPRRFDAQLNAEVLFEPRIQVGQLVQLESRERIYNGRYQINGIAHKGTISGAVCDNATTTVSLWLGTERLVGVARSR